MSKTNVMIVEDEPLIASDIKGCLLAKGYDIFGLFHTKFDALAGLEDDAPDIALLDINLGNNMDGLEIGKLLHDHFDVPFIYLTSYSTRQVLEAAKPTHPMGYLVKPFEEEDLFTAIEVGLFNYPKFIKKTGLSVDKVIELARGELTSKELEIASDIYDGLTNRQIGEKHFLSPNTIKTHVQHIYDKLDVHARSELIALLRNLT